MAEPTTLERHDDQGRPQEQLPLDGQGVLNGEVRLYSRGRLDAIIQYVDGKREGPATFFSETGTRLMQVNYRADKLHGQAQYFDPQDRLVRQSLFENDDLSGRTTEFYPSGKPPEIKGYAANLLEGILTRSAEDGKVTERVCYRGGREIPCPGTGPDAK